ncbi:MAG: hypothetical protein WA970_07170 [Gammaproteobacteria bacterium]
MAPASGIGHIAAFVGQDHHGWRVALARGAIRAGGVITPVLLTRDLAAMPASGVSRLLNAESAFTALLVWFAFREHADKRIAFGMVDIVAWSVVLSWPAGGRVELASL